MAGSTTVLAAVLLVDLVAFGLAIGAEQSRPTNTQLLLCGKPRLASLSEVHALSLMKSQQASLQRKGAHEPQIALAVSQFVDVLKCARLTFLIAEACLLAGLVQSAYHTGYRPVIFENPPDCETVRWGTFGAGAAFALITGVLTGSYYYCFSKSRGSYQRPEAAIGMSRFQ
ncbi:hypothetical protein ACQ4PT_023618 [Festuca glaucescens]